MYCIECGQILPTILTNSAICSKCKTPVATWWDETSKTFRTNRESILPDPASKSSFSLTSGASPFYLEERERAKMKSRPNQQTEEERVFNGALVVLEMHFQRPGVYLRDTMGEAKKMIAKTLDLSLNKAEVRETLAKNVDVWKRLKNIFTAAITLLESRSLQQIRTTEGESNGQHLSESTSSTHLESRSLHRTRSVDGEHSGHDVSECAELILKNYEVLREDLHYLNNLLVISRNMLAIKETAQEICKTVEFDGEVHRLIVLCVNVTSKGYDGENVDEARRVKLNEVTELYKKLLVTCLQHTHNWTMGNDRFKMCFWFEMLFDDELKNEPIHEMPPDDLNVEKVHQEVQNWISRHRKKDPLAAQLLQKYQDQVETGYTPGPLPERGSWLDTDNIAESKSPIWKPDVQDKFEQDRLYGRVSHEIDIWWKKVRDANFDGWVVPMETVEGAVERAEACKKNAMHRYMPRGQDQQYEEDYPKSEQQPHDDEGSLGPDDVDDRSTREDNGLEDEEEDEEDDESYADGPLRGLLTEIPNILDTKQIEALHMTVKACIVDSMGSGLTPTGENLQKTRCKMFLALDCGRNLLRELLVFIAVWEQTDQQFIFQITAQIIESFHHNALLPFAWNSLRILKDIVSPAQTVLLRLINYMFRARKDSPIYADVKDYNRDAKLIHFLYNYFRCRVVPDCLALLQAQAQIRQNVRAAADFPVDLWDMERAKDGLSQYLDFISVIAEIPEMRHLLIEWDTVYEMVALLKALEAGVARKSIDEKPMPGQPGAARVPIPAGNSTLGAPNPDRPSGDQIPRVQAMALQEANSTHLQDTPHRFPWAGIKIQILIILTSLIAPTNTRRQGPGNPIVQKQLLNHEGIMPLLNCCVYDGHNEYLKERATLTIKFLMEGCKEAQDFVKELVPVKQAQAQAQAAARAAQEAQAHSSDSTKTENERPRQTAKAPPGSAPYIAKQNAIAAAKAQALAHAQSSGITLGASDVEKKMKEFERNIRSLKVGKELRDQEAEASSSANGGKEKKREVKIEFISARK